MGLIIVKSDFVGKFDLVKSTTDKIDSYIATYEKDLILDLLGSELGQLFINDLTDKIPVTDKYLTIFNPINTNLNDVEVRSKGIKNMLLGLIYFEYERDNRYKVSNIGQVKNNPDSGSNDFDNYHLFQRYNEAVVTYQNIQFYVSNNLETYPEYKGLSKQITYL